MFVLLISYISLLILVAVLYQRSRRGFLRVHILSELCVAAEITTLLICLHY